MTATAPEAPAAPGVGRRVAPTARLLLPASAPREAWLAARRGDWRDGTTRIGSSDVADILGIGYRTPAHVYWDKRGEITDDESGEQLLWGQLHEETVAREWARRNRSAVQRVGLAANIDRPWMVCTLDRRVTVCPLNTSKRETCALEIKTRTAWVAGRWLRAVPDDVLAQVLWQMAVTGFDHMHLAVLIGGHDYRQYTVRRAEYEDVIANLVTAADGMRRRVLAGDPPPPSEAAGDHPDRLVELYDRLHPDRSGAVEADLRAVGLIDEYESHRLAMASHKRAMETAKAELVALLGDAEMALADQDELYSYREQRGRPAVDLARLAEQWPDAYAACVRETKSRRLSINKRFRKSKES